MQNNLRGGVGERANRALEKEGKDGKKKMNSGQVGVLDEEEVVDDYTD